MRLTTTVCIGIRNVGDAADQGDFFTGTLKDALAWQIDKMQKLSIARRIEVVFGRNEDEVRVGLNLSKSTTTLQMAKYSSLFADILDSDSLIDADELAQPSASGEDSVRAPLPGDDYEG